jgi:hypothetical protein
MTEPDQKKPILPSFDPNNCETYAAACHCGTVQYDITLSPPLEQWKVVSCNCSICSRNGYLLVYPERSQLRMKSGEETLEDYSFGPKRILHKFCGRCGSTVFFDPRMGEYGEAPPDLLGINVSLAMHWHSCVVFELRCTGAHVSRGRYWKLGYHACGGSTCGATSMSFKVAHRKAKRDSC